MNTDVTCTETEESRLQREDEARMQELRRLFDLMDEREKRKQAVEVDLDRALSILSWDEFEDLDICPGLDSLERRHHTNQFSIPTDRIDQHRKWLSALRSAMPYLIKILQVNDSSLLTKLRKTVARYAEISYSNLLVVIQPKLQTLNSIKA